MTVTNYNADCLWTPDGWLKGARLGIQSSGDVVSSDAEAAGEFLGRYVLPGMTNLHSHAFQRAMAGLAERRGKGEDSFWTWRETMYAFASRLGPEALRAIATQLYVEMLRAGYTHVCEFHYLHHQPDGTPYADPAAMSMALIKAAAEAGIGLTLLPVLYMCGGFDGRPLAQRQRRFGQTLESYLDLLDRLQARKGPLMTTGIALHSLRAVPPEAMREVLAMPAAQDGPIHIHVAEQIGEVQDSMAVRDARPVEWLLDHAQVDARWCLIHATQMTAGETRRVASSGAVVGLCPTTEANLGDGLFPLADYLDAGGRLGIGSDSHISVSPVEELRWLEYGQRLSTRHRNIAARTPGASVGETLWRAAQAGGAQAAGLPADALTPGRRADLIVLDDASPWLAARDSDSLMDSFLFAGNAPLVRDVMVAGRWVIRDHRHHDQERIAVRYKAAVEALAAD